MLVVSLHTHCESFLTSSTLPNLIERAKQLGRTYFSCTDHGYLHSSYKAYNAAKKANLKPILGIELYFKDPLCSIVSGTKADRCKYFSITVYAQDQEAYQQICKMVSRQDFQTIEIREEKQNLFTWKDLEELSKYNIQIVLGGIHCLVGKAFLASDANIGLRLFEKIHNLFPNKLSIAIIAEPWQKKFSKVVEIKYVDNTSDSLLASDFVSTDRARKIKASDLIDRPGHTEIKSKVVGGIYTEIGKGIESCRLHTGFLPLSCDVTLKINKFLVLLAKRYSVPVLVSDYSYYANKDDKIVQHVVLENKDKIHANQHMKTHEEILDYLEGVMSLSLAEADKIVDNNAEWAKLFDGFELKYEWRLASTEGQDPLKKAMEIIKRNGRMKWDNPVYVNRLKTELEVIAKNGVKDLTPYFLPIVEILDHYKEQGHLTSVGRGSAGGSLFCYLLGITNIDPIRYDLPFNRFFSKTRIEMKKLPDIDTDLPQKITLTGEDGKSGFLYNRWGNKAGHISTRQTVRLRSAIRDADRYFNGKVSKEIERFVSGLPNAPQGVTDGQFVFGYETEEGEHVPGLLETNDDLQKYTKEHPKSWAVVEKAMGLTRAFSKHACISGEALVDCNGTIKKFKNSDYAVDKPIKVWSNGVKETILVCLNNGLSIKCTPDHKFITQQGEVEAKDLLGIEVDYKPFSNVSGNESLDPDTCFALGWGLNDGTFIKKGNQSFYFTPGKDDEARERIEKFLNRSNVKNWRSGSRPDTTYCGYTNLSPLFFESKDNDVQRLPEYFWKLNFESQCNFMRGFMSANGFVLNTRKRIGFKISSKLLANDICLWLSANNFKTSAVYNDPKDFTIRGKTYFNNGNVEVNITGFESRKNFYDLVGFEQTYKQKRLEEIVKEKNIKDTHSQRSRKIKCLKIVSMGTEEVFDFNEPIENMGYINGILVHNCAYVLSDIPIDQTIPVKEGYITHYEHKDVEKAGLVKYDFLTISQLLDIQICLELINKKNGDIFEPGYFRHNGVKTYIWDLPDEKDVYKSVWDGSTETLFQINSTGQSELAQEMLPSSLEDIAAALALERPGPKDYKDPETGHNMVREYLLRRRGDKDPDIKELAEILPEAYGVMYFQEHLGKIAKQLAGFTDEEAEILRENMAKKYLVELTKIKPTFIAGAIKKVSQEVAEKIWEQMVTFGRYGFSIIHSYEYAKITYACMFLRHNYKLDWWASVLSNADEKEITGKFWKHAKELIAPPDINLSTDKMVPDYKTGKIRAKLGVIRGMGEKTIEPIVANRPYKDIQDFVDKEIAGPSLAHKLIHVGVLDSLFKETMSLEEKLKAYEDAVEIKKYNTKKSIALQEGKKIRLTQPKAGSVPEAYLNLHPMKDVAMKKAVLPTMYADLYGLGAKYSKVIDKWSSKPKVIDPKFNKSVFLVDGNTVERLDKLDSTQIEKDIYVAATGYVIEAKEFDYHKGKRALKMVVACDNYISEKILWPDYETQELIYDKGLSKGSIITLFLRKRAGKGGELNVTKFVIET